MLNINFPLSLHKLFCRVSGFCVGFFFYCVGLKISLKTSGPILWVYFTKFQFKKF